MLKKHIFSFLTHTKLETLILKWGKMLQGNLSHIEGKMSQEQSVVGVAYYLGGSLPVAGQDVVGHGARCHWRGKILQGKLSRGNLMGNPHVYLLS